MDIPKIFNLVLKKKTLLSRMRGILMYNPQTNVLLWWSYDCLVVKEVFLLYASPGLPLRIQANVYERYECFRYKLLVLKQIFLSWVFSVQLCSTETNVSVMSVRVWPCSTQTNVSVMSVFRTTVQYLNKCCCHACFMYDRLGFRQIFLPRVFSRRCIVNMSRMTMSWSARSFHGMLGSSSHCFL